MKTKNEISDIAKQLAFWDAMDILNKAQAAAYADMGTARNNPVWAKLLRVKLYLSEEIDAIRAKRAK